MRYEGNIFRPPSEADSLLIQATIGCPHNKCTFCAMYKGEKFRMREVSDIKEDIDAAAKVYRSEYVRTMFFPDANTIIMPTEKLVEIFEYSYKVFPFLKRITVYGGARFVGRKSVEELKMIEKAGLRRIHTGMESGDDVVLERVRKGVSSDKIIEAGKRVIEAGIELSEYYMVGLGGMDRLEQHALESARVLSAINPTFIRLRTATPIPGTELFDQFQSGAWCLPGPHHALREIKMLVENLNCESSLLSDHNSNYCDISGRLPGDRKQMIDEIDNALKMEESGFRPYESVRL